MWTSWGQQRSSLPNYYDKAYKRAELPAWDDRWHTLSLPARHHLLSDVKAASSQRTPKRPTVAASRFPAAVLDELCQAGFVQVQEVGNRKLVTLVDDAISFISRVRALGRYHLLAADGSGDLGKYLSYCFNSYQLQNALYKVLGQVNINPYLLFGDLYQDYVTGWRWPGWVAEFLADPLAQPIFTLIEKAGGKVPLNQLASQLPGKHSPSEVRATVEKLITHLTLFEDLNPQTLEIEVGFHPRVHAGRLRAQQTVPRPTIERGTPIEPGPEAGIDIPDLRLVLLELAGARARLKQNHSLFQKETERFNALLDPLPSWMIDRWRLFEGTRVSQAISWARTLRLVHVKAEGDIPWLELTSRGQQWLTTSLEKQYADLYAEVRNPKERSVYSWGDRLFLGSHVTAIKEKNPGKRTQYDFSPGYDLARLQPLRDALHRALSELPLGEYCLAESFIAHAAHGKYNPVLLGGDREHVAVRLENRLVPPLEEMLEEVGRKLLRDFLYLALIPLGCLQAGQDAQGRLVIARLPRLDHYFGKELTEPDTTAPAAQATRVVVQPDFSIVIIGLNPAPVADLLPFCERVKGSTGQGAVTLRLTRDSVVRASTAGLQGAEILARLERHASIPLPRNVVQEVTDWAAWVRKVQTVSAILLRCPDAACADRVKSALGKNAERLNDTTVAFWGDRLGSAERQKLRSQGVIIEGDTGKTATRKKRKKW
jgi:hypothetical protein